jgi:branched-chain amino acid aminotransferase
VSQLAWLNQELVSYEEAKLDTAGWPTGSGTFETIKTVNGLPWALSRHMRRALNTARRNDHPFPTEELIRRAVIESIAANPFKVGRLRILFGDDGSLCVTHQEYLELTKPANLGIGSHSREGSGIVEKRYPYIENLESLRDAQSQGFDDFLLINSQGCVTETAIANLVFQIDDLWVTPPLSDGVLPGVMRALLIEKAGVSVRQIKADRVQFITCGFIVSSLKIAQPIAQINGRDLQISKESERMRSLFAATALATSVG